MNKQALSLAVFIAGAYPAASSALGLGDIESSTHLNQPLRAKIDLLSAAPADAGRVQVRLAPPEVFNRVGVARPDYLSKLRFQSTVQNGKPVILVTSSEPIAEPFVNFLLEVSWPQGQLLKEYTVMLDPPVLMQPGNTLAGEASVRAEPKAAGNVRRQQQAAPAPTRQATTVQPRQPQAVSQRTYRVRPGDTLFGVAKRLNQSGVSNDRMMMALFRANPNAFINNNINNLRAGAVLKAPSSAQLNSLADGEARRAVRQQNAEWRQLRRTLAKKTVPQKTVTAQQQAATPQPVKPAAAGADSDDKARLEVLGAQKQGEAGGGDAAAGASSAKLAELEKQLALARESLTARQKENNELKSRVSDLESMLGKKNRLIDLRNQQLADLQQQLQAAGVTTNKPVETAETPEIPEATAGEQPARPAVDQGRDIANVAGQNDNAVIRSGQPDNQAATGQQATDAATPPARPEEQRLTPATAALGQSSNIPLKPPADRTDDVKPEEKPAVVVPVTPEDGGEDKPAPVFADQAGADDDILSLLTSPLALKIGAGSLALLALLWLLGRRRKSEPDVKDQKDVADEDIIDLDSELDDNVDLNSLETELKKAEQGSADDPFGIQGGSSGDDWDNDVRDDDSLAAPKTAAGGVSIADTDEDEDELLTEANVYIAYGLYQQAESELKKGIEREPDNLEYRHKLLECYFQSNNREAFDAQAQQFAELPGAGQSSLWASIAEWGRKISPDNALYQEGGLENRSSSVSSTVAAALGGASAAALAGAAFAHDDDARADETPTGKSQQPDLPADDFDLDLDTGMDKLDDTPLSPSPSIDDFNDDLDLGEMDFDDIDLDKLLQGDDSAEDPVRNAVLPDGHQDNPESLDMGGEFDEPLPELDLDLDDDLPELKAEEGAVAHSGESGQQRDFVADDNDDLLDLLDDGDSDTVVAPPAVRPVVAAGNTATSLNLHLDNDNVGRILPKDTFYAPAEGEEQEDWLGDIDDALSFLDFPDEEIDLHEAHISTKLDLARAYLDMGDIEGARSTLEEVMVEGNDDQRREAEVLLHQSG